MQLNDHLDWTQKLGDAMIAQQQDVADSIQRLRAKAADGRQPEERPQQTVTTAGLGRQHQYVIEPANPEVVYVPSLQPDTGPTGRGPTRLSAGLLSAAAGLRSARAGTGLMWGVGIAAAGAMYRQLELGRRGGSYVNVNVNRAVNIDNNFDRNRTANGGRWQHRGRASQGRRLSRQRHAPAIRPARPGARPAPAVPRPGRRTGRAAAGRRQTGSAKAGAVRRCRAAQAVRAGPRRPGGAGQAQGTAAGPWPGGNRARRRLGGVNRGQQVNREAATRQTQQQNRGRLPTAAAVAVAARGGGGGGGGGGAGAAAPVVEAGDEQVLRWRCCADRRWQPYALARS